MTDHLSVISYLTSAAMYVINACTQNGGVAVGCIRRGRTRFYLATSGFHVCVHCCILLFMTLNGN